MSSLRVFFCLSLLLCCTVLCAANLLTYQDRSSQATSGQAPPIRTTISLVLVDVMAQDKNSGEPIKDLNEEDFRLRDNGKPVPITRFSRGKEQALRPVQLWFLMACNEERTYPGGEPGGGRRGAEGGGGGNTGRQHGRAEVADKSGSGFLAGKGAELLPALEHLRAEETVGVAHWCDNGLYDIDSAPSTDRPASLRAMDEVAGRKAVVIEQIPSQNSQDQATRLINRVARTAFPEPFLGLVVVKGKESESVVGLPVSTLRDLTGDLTGDVKTDATQDSGKIPTTDTWYSLGAQEYANRLGTFIDSLHSRYEIGFEPGKREQKLHRVSIALTKSARERYPNILLTYREAYSATGEPAEIETGKEGLDWRNLDSRMQSAIKSRLSRDEVPFEAQRTRDSAGHTEHYVLKMPPSALTWNALPNGSRRTVVMTVVASYAAKGSLLSMMVKELEIVQEFDRLAEIAGKPVVLSLNTGVVKGAARVRVVVRDVATGHIGTKDLQTVPELSSPGVQ